MHSLEYMYRYWCWFMAFCACSAQILVFDRSMILFVAHPCPSSQTERRHSFEIDHLLHPFWWLPVSIAPCVLFPFFRASLLNLNWRDTILNELSRFLWNRCRQFRFLCESWCFLGKCILFDSYWFHIQYIDSVNVHWKGACPTWEGLHK